MQIHVIDLFFRLLEVRFVTVFRNIWDDPIIEKSQDQDQGQGQGQDQIMRQRSALQQQMVLALALTMTLVLVLRFFDYRVVPDIPSLITFLEC